MNGPYELSWLQVASAAALIVINALISIWLRLGMERSLLLAAVRTVVQLTLIGFVLEWVFEIERLTVVILLAIVMTAIAGWTAAGRGEKTYPGMLFNVMLSVWTSSWLVTSFALFVVLRETNAWYQPQYAIPLLGMVLGNTLNGIAVGVTTLTDSLDANPEQVDAMLGLGANRWEAAAPAIQRAVRTGMIPIINSMMVVGLVSLPGMMTGQLLSGTSPLIAVKYQIVIMFLIAAATGLGTVMSVVLGFFRLFNRRHQFLKHRLMQR